MVLLRITHIMHNKLVVWRQFLPVILVNGSRFVMIAWNHLFDNLEVGIEFYKKYDAIVGFDTRLSTNCDFRDDVPNFRYMVCIRAGFKEASTSTVKRKRLSKRFGCTARICFKFVSKETCAIYLFDERHTHPLVENLAMPFLNRNRKLDVAHEKFMLNYAKVKLGPSKIHQLLRVTMEVFWETLVHWL